MHHTSNATKEKVDIEIQTILIKAFLIDQLAYLSLHNIEF